VVLVSDAGVPLVSDPGYVLVTAAIERGLAVTVLPGPSAVTAAVALAGVPASRWCFEGFLPRRSGERRTRLRELAGDPRALVFFESPKRLAASLRDVAAAFGGGRRAAVCRELTKRHEEVRRGSLDELVTWADSGEVLGEITVVVAGATEPATAPDPAELRGRVEALVVGGATRRDAVDRVAAESGMPRRVVYHAANRRDV
jgi:16S rRNA (cytidine1402-2'-O)-methyltransferase